MEAVKFAFRTIIKMFVVVILAWYSMVEEPSPLTVLAFIIMVVLTVHIWHTTAPEKPQNALLSPAEDEDGQDKPAGLNKAV